jgi:hypothetical protein
MDLKKMVCLIGELDTGVDFIEKVAIGNTGITDGIIATGVAVTFITEHLTLKSWLSNEKRDLSLSIPQFSKGLPGCNVVEVPLPAAIPGPETCTSNMSPGREIVSKGW